MSDYRAVLVDGVSVPTTAAGAAAVELLQAKLRDAAGVIDGLQGQLDALRAVAQRAPDSRQEAAAAHNAMARRLADGWRERHAAS